MVLAYAGIFPSAKAGINAGKDDGGKPKGIVAAAIYAGSRTSYFPVKTPVNTAFPMAPHAARVANSTAVAVACIARSLDDD